MGLDIYFYKVKNVSKSKDEQLDCIDFYLDLNEKKAKQRVSRFANKSLKRLKAAKDENEYKEIYLDIFQNEKKGIPKFTKYRFEYEDMISDIQYDVDKVKEFFNDFKRHYYAQEDAYFRKVNFVYHFFSPKLQNECCFVTKEDLKELISRCKRVLKNKSKRLAEELLPTQSGFFFGSTDYDEYYFDDVKDCKMQMKKLLKGFNEEKDVILVVMSW